MPSSVNKTLFFFQLRSVKCRFTLLGMFLGLVLSLGAIIPIVTIWQISGNRIQILRQNIVQFFSTSFYNYYNCRTRGKD